MVQIHGGLFLTGQCAASSACSQIGPIDSRFVANAPQIVRLPAKNPALKVWTPNPQSELSVNGPQTEEMRTGANTFSVGTFRRDPSLFAEFCSGGRRRCLDV
jgi:hypothetical protein